MISRTSKQLVIGGVYILLAALIAGGIYISHSQTSCTDGIQNGKEEGVDCGTLACGQACASPIQALMIKDAHLIRTPADDYDLVFEVTNPNSDYGSGDVEYSWTFYDGNSPEPHREGNGGTGRFYVLPGQTKYVIATAVHFQSAMTPDDVPMIKDVLIKSITWQKVTGDSSVLFTVVRDSLSSTATSAVYEGVISNNSDFDFGTVDIGFIARDASGRFITTSTTNLQTFISHTQRSVKAQWPFPLPADAHVEVEVGTNVFQDANFLKRNGTLEQFQQYY